MAQALEDMHEVVRYVKNHNLGFTIPYTLERRGARTTIPDFIVRIGRRARRGRPAQPDHRGHAARAKQDKAAKVATARTLWVPAVNNHGGFGRWAFVEIADPWDAIGPIREAIRG